jgi:hypothetical protein
MGRPKSALMTLSDQFAVKFAVLATKRASGLKLDSIPPIFLRRPRFSPPRGLLSFCARGTLKILTMAAGMTDRLWSVEIIVALFETAEPEPAKRGC